ncbi:OmpW family outer membrane protein [Winogradskyella aurantia]|uniref:Outer membrane protein beta-barrel domain-containing protein n=1 Tax=Winogradskyella aurantia TaxID=1915063 RepID=A0A265UX73_9FLAO|nr:OmpW family outer membrane protein [Winogradskyella aurantia]OZV69915.1 hypothetical protein CA834_04660 [Winogradskyella aurantia]
MKNLFLTICAVFALATINAQEEAAAGFSKGDVFVSGTVGFTSSSQDDSKQNNLNFSPSVGYFITENIAAEFGLIVGSNKIEQGEFERTISDFGAALGANYFFTPSNRFSFVIGAGLSYVNTTDKEDGFEDVKINTFAIAVAPGINYFVSSNFALRASIGALSYSSSKADFDGAEALNTFGLNLNLSDINFGVTYKF